MEAIGLNPIRLDAIGIDPIRLNAIRLGVPGASSGSDRPYIAPEVLASLVAVVKCDGKSNNDPDRAIIKNLVDPDNPFVISNAAYKLNSGYGKYEEDFTTWNYDSSLVTSITSDSVTGKSGRRILWIETKNRKDDLPSFKVKIELSKGSVVRYWYVDENGSNGAFIDFTKSGEYQLPISYYSKYTGEDSWDGFVVTKGEATITQIPSFQGSFYADGVNDMITSTKTMSEMLGGGNKCTVISFITHISGAGKYNVIGNNRIQVSDYSGQSFMAGCSSKSGEKIVELGDKEKIQAFQYTTFDSKLSIGSLESGLEISSYAYYGTFVFNKDSVPIDWIHQVIAYFYLDKYVTPGIIYDTIRQGITNENHASFNDELVDFSGNGHNLKIYNSAWNKESGINDEGAWQTDAVEDYGQFVGDLGLKDYTVAVDRAYPSLKGNGVPVISNIKSDTATPFLFEFADNTSVVRPYSFGATTVLSPMELSRKISYQSTYIYDGTAINKGLHGNTGDGLTIGKFGIDTQYANIALWSLLLFPYTLSEFLLERQLKKYKLGTLHLDMVEFRPVVKSNVEYSEVCYLNYTHNLATIKSGDYVNIGDTIAARIVLNNTLDEVANAKVNGQECEVVNVSPRVFDCKFIITSKSPQKIDITIDEYIRYEDMDFTSAYPLIPIIDGYTYGDKLKVGTEVNYVKFSNLLPNVYSRRGEMQLNGVNIENNTLITVSKYMVFSINKTWLLDTTEPHAIYSPQKLNIPNSSLKILGYVPDLTGKGNHGKLNNFAYTEDSGVTADGSVKFDGTDDHITIPTLAHGGKCVMMKVNWNKNNSMLYDQRVSYSTKFAVLINAGTIAYNQTNPLGVTYIDGIENTNILCDELKGITHNIVSANANPDNSKSPNIGVNLEGNGGFSDMSLYEFMLFPEIPSEDEIKKLNNVMGIEGGYVESPNYYWDSFGKSNNQADDIDKGIRNINDSRIYLFDKSVEGLSTIEQINISGQIRPLLNRALQLKNVGYNSESGYNGYIELLFNKWSVFINENRAEIDRTGTTLNITKVYIQNKAILYCGIGHYLADIPSKYKITGVDDTHPIKFGNDGFPNELILTVTKDGEYEVDWYNYGKNPCIMAGFIGDCNITIEQVAQYPNGLLLDGVEDHAVNTVIPAVTDFTVIAKRSTLDTNINSAFVTKGTSNTYNKAAFMLEFKSSASIQIGSFGILNNGQNIPDLITYMTPTDYNKAGISKGTAIDENGLIMGKYSNTHYWNGVFYKLMFYTKTIDQLSINMLKNLFERDELIDVTNPIFKKQ